VTGLQSAWLGITLMALGAAWGVVAIPAVAGRLPALSLKRPHGKLFSLDVSLPERYGRKRLKRETLALAEEIHNYVKAQPSSSASALVDHHNMVRAMEATETEDEKNRVWEEHTRVLTETYDQERRELGRRFGGRISYLASEYQRRDFLTESEVSKLEWETGSMWWIQQAATKLEALAHRL
jgi:hypothetical protein